MEAPGGLSTALIVLITGQPGMAGRMLAEHVDDGSGHCRSCRWHARPATEFPCVLRTHAEAADRSVLVAEPVAPPAGRSTRAPRPDRGAG